MLFKAAEIASNHIYKVRKSGGINNKSGVVNGAVNKVKIF